MTGWHIVPAHEDGAELLLRHGIPAVWMQTIEPVMSGLAFPAEHSAQALTLLGLPSDGWEASPTDVDECSLLVRPVGPAARHSARRGYVDLCTLRLGQEAQDIARNLQATEAHIASLMQDLARAQTKAALARETLSHFQRYSKRREEHWAREFDRLLEHPRIASIEVVEGGLRVRTTPIHIASGARRYLIGSFDLALYLGGRMTVTNVQNAGRDSTYDHPHVKAARACLGNLAGPLAKLLGEFELATAVYLLVEFLETYNTDSAYASVTNWKEVG